MKRNRIILNILVLIALGCGCVNLHAQELNMKINLNHAQVQTTKTSIFDNLQKAMTDFMNDRQWTNLKFRQNERISCSMNIIVTKYDESTGKFTGTMQLQCNRPVFNATYTTVSFAMKDNNFNFTYQEFDKLDFRTDQVDNNLTALMAYYAYLIIGFDMDTMAPLGGTEILHTVETIVTNAQNIGEAGWKSFDDTKNRFAIINDYMDGTMEPYRQMQYAYHRKGLDQMSDNPEEARTAITESLGLLKKAHSDRPLSQLPQIFTDYKRDEIVNIYAGKADSKEKEDVYDILFNINPSQNAYWEKIKK
jgi:hypothetical protein